RVRPPPAAEVMRGLGRKVAVILDGGRWTVGVEATVVSCMGERATLLRPGGLSRSDIEKVLGHGLHVEADSAQPHSPGEMESHYAPHAFLRLDATAPHKGESYLGFGSHDHGPYTLSARGDVVEAAANLFRLLHELDGLGV